MAEWNPIGRFRAKLYGTLETARHEEKRSSGITLVLCMSVVGTCCGANLALGYNISVINTPSSIIKTFFSDVEYRRSGSTFTDRGLEWFWSSCVAAFPVLAPFGCFVGSKSAKRFGRKESLMINSALLILSSLMQTLSKPLESYELFLMGRLLTGFQTGIACSVAPMYICEVSPKKYRGAVSAMNSLSFTVGILLSAILAFEEVLGGKKTWHYLFIVPSAFAIFQLVAMIFCPESPYFLLICKNERLQAAHSLKTLRGAKFDLEEEIQEIIAEDSKIRHLPDISYTDFFRKRELLRPLLLAFGAVSCVQFSGITAIILYSRPIFDAALTSMGYPDSHMASRFVSFLTVERLIVNACAVPFLDKWGRRNWELLSIAGITVCCLSLAFLLSDLQTDNQTCYGFSTGTIGGYITLAVILMHSLFAAPGVNTFAWVLPSELFRTNARPKALFLCFIVYWFGSFVNSFGFELLQNVLCGWVFLVFAFYQIFIFIYFWKKLPVIDGKTTDQIATLFETIQECG